MLKEYLNRLTYLDHLIKSKSGGPPEQLARRLNISERTLFETLKHMKSLGAPIRYCRYRKLYYYEEDGTFCFEFKKIGNII